MNWQIINHGLTIDDNLTSDKLRVLCQDQNAVLRSVIESFRQIMPQAPPLGFRPIHIYYRSSCPIINSTADVNCYCIGLASVNRHYFQMAYQFAHEFCHIYADPRITNWFIESICEMMSQHTLRHLSEKWATNPPVPHWKPDAPKFREYLHSQLKEVHQRTIGINVIDVGKQSLSGWLSKNISDLTQKPNNRDRNTIIAEIIKPIFESARASWKIIPFLGKASSPYPETLTELRENSEFSFDKLQEIVPENAKGIVQQMRDILPL